MFCDRNDEKIIDYVELVSVCLFGIYKAQNETNFQCETNKNPVLLNIRIEIIIAK